MACFARERGDPANDRSATFLIRLNGKTQALPILERRIAPRTREELEGKLKPLRFLRVDRHADPAALGGARKIDHRWRELGNHAFTLRVFIARMQRR